MNELFKKFENIRVGIVGDVMIDTYLWGDVERISPEAPIPIVAINKREHRLGGAANVALNIKTLGAHPVLFTIVGNDVESELLKSLLVQNDIPNEMIIESSNRATTVKTRILARNQQMLRYDSEVTDYINANEAEMLLNHIKMYVEEKKPDVLIFQDYNKGVLNDIIIKEVIRVCNGKNIPTLVDPKKVHFNSYVGCTLFKPNLSETMEGLNIHIDSSKKTDLIHASRKLNECINNKITLFTLSDKGIFVSDGTKHELLPSHVRDVSDVSGAGDTVVSLAALCMAVDLNIFYMAKLANIAGGLVCEEVGVVPVDVDKLKKEAILINHD